MRAIVRTLLRRLPVLVALSRGQRQLVRQALLPRRRRAATHAAARYLATHPVRKLQLGSGPNPLPGWLNTDLTPEAHPSAEERLLFLDAMTPFPLPDMCLDYVFSEHMIEHLAEAGARRMISESFRVLRPGGRIRVATPDLAAIVGVYERPVDPEARHYIDWVMATLRPDVTVGNNRCYVVNQMFNSYGHRFIYDEETLTAVLLAAGFICPVRQKPGESTDPNLQGLEAHGRALGDEEVNRFETLVLEARRPSSGR
jgi:predicted SAM-dependent methyltransferase